MDPGRGRCYHIPAAAGRDERRGRSPGFSSADQAGRQFSVPPPALGGIGLGMGPSELRFGRWTGPPQAPIVFDAPPFLITAQAPRARSRGLMARVAPSHAAEKGYKSRQAGSRLPSPGMLIEKGERVASPRPEAYDVKGPPTSPRGEDEPPGGRKTARPLRRDRKNGTLDGSANRLAVLP